MEDKALETLRTLLARRGLPTTTTAVEPGKVYTIGDKTVVFIKTYNPTKTTIDKLVEAYPKNLILVSMLPPSDSIRTHMRTATEDRPSYIADGIQLFHLAQLQYDIMSHKKYGFPCRILTKAEVGVLTEALKLSRLSQLPRVLCDDPYPLWLGAKPEDVLEYEIPSEAAGWSKKYRLVVTNVDDV